MKLKNKKGFTIIELVIVIAVIGVLTAVLVPTFISLTNKANEAADQSLVKNLNTVIATVEAEAGYKKGDTPSDSFAKLDDLGYNVEKLVKGQKSGKKILYNLNKNRFLFEESKTSAEYKDFKAEDFWTFAAAPDTTGYSTYLYNEYSSSNPLNINSGLDVGINDDISNVVYTNDSGKSVIIRTNSAATSLTVNAPNDSVHHFGDAGSVNIIAVKGSSYHENGKTAFLEVANGRVALEANSEVSQIHLTATEGNFNNITVAKASGVELPDFSRDPVVIPAEGKCIVALQEGTTNPEAQKDYVWLTAVGVYEQVAISTSSTSAGTTYAAESGSATQKEAAQQIANNITFSQGGNDYKVTATKVGENWTYEVKTVAGEATAYTATIENNDVVVKDGETPVETTKENGLTEEQKEEAKAEIIDELAGEEVAKDPNAENYVARVGTKGYLTLKEAVDAAAQDPEAVVWILKNEVVLTDDIGELQQQGEQAGEVLYGVYNEIKLKQDTNIVFGTYKITLLDGGKISRNGHSLTFSGASNHGGIYWCQNLEEDTDYSVNNSVATILTDLIFVNGGAQEPASLQHALWYGDNGWTFGETFNAGGQGATGGPTPGSGPTIPGFGL